MPEEMAMAVAFPEMMSWNIYFFYLKYLHKKQKS